MSNKEIKGRKLALNNLGAEGTAGIFLGIVLILCSLFVGNFFSLINFRNILVQISISAVVAMGMQIVILSGGIDLSVGANVAAVGMFMGVLMTKWGWPVLPSVLLGLLLGTAIGWLNGVLIAKADLAPFIVTLGTMSIARGISYLVTNGAPLFDFPDEFLLFVVKVGGVINLPIIIMIVVVAATIYILKYTKIGRYSYAIGGNESACNLSGINVANYKIAIYSLQGLLCGLASCILTARLDSAMAVAGEGYELDAIAAVVIGGTSMSGGKGKVFGTIIGVLLLGVMSNAMNLLSIPTGLQRIVKGIIIILAVLMDTFRKRQAKRRVVVG